MFKKRIIGLTLVWALLAGGSIWFFRAPLPADYLNYQKLMEYSDNSAKCSDKDKPFATQQQRYHVTKQFLFFKEQERLQWRLKSESSELRFGQQGESVELVEYFKTVSCAMQEKILVCPEKDCKPPLDSRSERAGLAVSQLVRCLDAKQAVYHYKNEQLVAEDAFLTRYKLPGHQWIDALQGFKPLMTGKAERVQLSFSQQDPSFKAQGLQATFQDWGTAF